MKTNNKKPTGVLNYKLSAELYRLRRYFPSEPLRDLIEQFWFVDWDLTNNTPHIQRNLPDPNFHLILDNQKIKLIGPMSKTYAYKMEGIGNIVGIKFALGALSGYLDSPIASYVDKEIDLQQLVDFDVDGFISRLTRLKDDEQTIDLLQAYLAPFAITPSPELIRVRELISLIKNRTDITKVAQLSEKSNISIRTIQRYFQHYLGLSPKWLIRKYRLHQALALIEQQEANLLDIVEWLGYTDQSHLIRDFKEIIGVTPKNYTHPLD